MSTTKQLLERIARRAEAEPDKVLPALRVLAGEPPDEEVGHPTRPDPVLHSLALDINRARVAKAQSEFVAHAWPTDRVARHLRVSSRQAVAQRRSRRGLLGAQVGTTVFYPAWQFNASGLAAGLDRLLAELPSDARAADDIMQMPHDELGGRRLADLYLAGEWDELVVWLRDIVDPEMAESGAADRTGDLTNRRGVGGPFG